MNRNANRIAYKRSIAQYLSELNCFCKKTPAEAYLLSLEETKSIQNSAKVLENGVPYRLTIGFDEKIRKRFSMFINKLYKANSSPIYIWISLTNICGTYEIDSILEFNFDFDFEAISEGIIVLLAKNFSDKITLEFYINDADQKVLDIELIGTNWSGISY